MNLFVSAMQSKSLSEKIKALTSLKSTIESLDFPEPPIIDLPPPMDASRIALTHRQGSILSDMPDGNFAPQWATWEHTYSSVMKQFTPSEVKTGATELPLSPSKEMQTLLEIYRIPLFRIFNDRSEKCRQLALQCTILMCLHTANMGKHLPFLMSAIQARYPESYLDEEMNIFIGDADLHDRYKRGSAEEREDRTFLLSSGSTFNVIENSEMHPRPLPRGEDRKLSYSITDSADTAMGNWCQGVRKGFGSGNPGNYAAPKPKSAYSCY